MKSEDILLVCVKHATTCHEVRVLFFIPPPCRRRRYTRDIWQDIEHRQ